MRLLSVRSLALCALALMSVTSFAGTIVGSAHDFSALGWNTSGQICKPCHVPHNAVVPQIIPLWSHTTTAQSGSYTIYTGPTGTMNAATGQPAGVSLACLSCHDGTVNLDAFGGAAGTVTMGAIPANLGTNLSNDHPISFVYNAALATADGGLFNPTIALSGLGGTIEADLLYGAAGSKTLECASCHDPHNGAGVAKLLRKSNAGSALCLTCHNK